jgi:hypothetical protein
VPKGSELGRNGIEATGCSGKKGSEAEENPLLKVATGVILATDCACAKQTLIGRNKNKNTVKTNFT